MDCRVFLWVVGLGSFCVFGLVCVFLPVLTASAGHAVSAPAGQGDAASCAALADQSIAADTVIVSAQYMPEGGMVGTTKITLPFCRAIGVATPTADSHIGFEVWLPPASSWTGKLQGEGSGGAAGASSAGAMLEALK